MGLISGSIDDFISKYLASPKEIEIGIGGWPTKKQSEKFWGIAFVKRRVLFESEITSTYVEDGSFLHDHIILQPVRIQIEGVVGDMHLRPSPLLEAIRRAEAEVGNITQFLPGRTQAQESVVEGLVNSALDKMNLADAYIAAGGQVLDLVNGGRDGKTPQQDFVQSMHGWWQSHSLIGVDFTILPFSVPMAIRSFQAETNNQSEEARFTLELQQVRVAQVLTQTFVNVSSGAKASVQDKPVTEGAQTPQQLGSALIETMKFVKAGVVEFLNTTAPNVMALIK